MATITDIEGTLVSSDIIHLITELYADIPIVKDLKINIRGDSTKIDRFLKYVDSHPEYFTGIGCEPPVFVVLDTDGAPRTFLISSDDPGEDLDDIMVHFV